MKLLKFDGISRHIVRKISTYAQMGIITTEDGKFTAENDGPGRVWVLQR
jgi:hypothetical protein